MYLVTREDIELIIDLTGLLDAASQPWPNSPYLFSVLAASESALCRQGDASVFIDSCVHWGGGVFVQVWTAWPSAAPSTRRMEPASANGAAC